MDSPTGSHAPSFLTMLPGKFRRLPALELGGSWEFVAELQENARRDPQAS